jgi:hypothetical protein
LEHELLMPLLPLDYSISVSQPHLATLNCVDKVGITGDTKAGTLIATDRYGNKYYENLEEELPRG